MVFFIVLKVIQYKCFQILIPFKVIYKNDNIPQTSTKVLL